MAEQDLEYLMEKNPHLSRRDILKLLGMVTTLGAFAACAPTYSAVPNEDPITLGKTVTPGGQSIKRRGPDLFEVHTNEFSDYARHRRKNTTGGIDFNIRDPDIFPVAEGIVTEVKTYEDAGLMVRISHGWLSSKYAHLQEEFVDPGQHVSRTDKIAIGGQTGSGAKTGHHLHLGIYTLPDIVQILNKLFNLDSDLTRLDLLPT
jgi:murein DD-endopeptidase MepM/ murein hydrolase activator NlpD